MSRLFAPIAVLVLMPVGCSKPAAEADPGPSHTPKPQPPLVAQAPAPVVTPPVPQALPVAPHPRRAGDLFVDERDLINEDPGIDFKIEAALPEIKRIEKEPVDPLPSPLPTDPPLNIPGLKLPREALPGPPNPGLPGVEPMPAFAARTGKAKAKLLEEFGGNEDTEKAVALGLEWLARQQKKDGSWEFDGSEKKDTAGATGMAVLAFLGAGETPKDSKKYKKTVQAGLKHLMDILPLGGKDPGKFATSRTMYSQAIGTLALVEAYGMTKDKAQLLPHAQAAVNFIQKAQAKDGSWGYQPAAANGDTSILGWQMQALHAARLTKDIKVDEKVVKNAVGFLDAVAGGEKKSKYGYSKASLTPREGTSLTAIGLLCRARFDGWDAKNPGLTEGVEGLLKSGSRVLDKATLPDMYFVLAATQTLREYGGEEWRTWNEGPKAADGTRKGGMRDTLLNLQVKQDGANLGSWEADKGFVGPFAGRLGSTALAVLALEAPYRHLPVVPAKKPDEPKKP
jgi:hypothetical protein